MYLVSNIVKKFIENCNCTKLIVKDGITSNEFFIEHFDNLLQKVSVNVEKIRNKCPVLGTTVSIAKNLDHYQNIICCEIRDIQDSNPIKILLQELRIIIISTFVKLTKSISELKLSDILNDELFYWNKYAHIILVLVSEIILRFKQGESKIKLNHPMLKEILDYFGVKESEIIEELLLLY